MYPRLTVFAEQIGRVPYARIRSIRGCRRMCLACRSPGRLGTDSTMGPTARTTGSTTSSRPRIRRRPCSTLGAQWRTGQSRPCVGLKMGTNSVFVSAGFVIFYASETDSSSRVAACQTLGHITTVSFFGASLVMLDGVPFTNTHP